MNYTKFKIVAFGDRTNAKVNGFNALINTWYNASDVLTVHKNNPSLFGEPFDVIKFKVTDDVIESNVGNITINVPPNKVNSPLSSNFTGTIANNTEYTVINNIPFNDAVDRIKILSFTNEVGQLIFDTNNIYPGFEILHYDFNLLKFKSKNGFGSPYFNMTYQVGNADGYNNTIYSLNYNIFGQASLTQDSEETLTDEFTKSLSFDVKINNGWVNKTAKINVAVNLSASAWPTNTQNFFNFNYNLHEIKNNSNFNQDFIVNLDGNGFAAGLTKLD